MFGASSQAADRKYCHTRRQPQVAQSQRLSSVSSCVTIPAGEVMRRAAGAVAETWSFGGEARLRRKAQTFSRSRVRPALVERGTGPARPNSCATPWDGRQLQRDVVGDQDTEDIVAIRRSQTSASGRASEYLS